MHTNRVATRPNASKTSIGGGHARVHIPFLHRNSGRSFDTDLHDEVSSLRKHSSKTNPKNHSSANVAVGNCDSGSLKTLLSTSGVALNISAVLNPRPFGLTCLESGPEPAFRDWYLPALVSRQVHSRVVSFRRFQRPRFRA
jgi:hypothetical protein